MSSRLVIIKLKSQAFVASGLLAMKLKPVISYLR